MGHGLIVRDLLSVSMKNKPFARELHYSIPGFGRIVGYKFQRQLNVE